MTIITESDSIKEFVDPKHAFQEAITAGILSENCSDPNYAGNFMYMWTIKRIHHFKNIDTRKYGYDQETIIKATENLA
jgi:hypothetical protein